MSDSLGFSDAVLGGVLEALDPLVLAAEDEVVLLELLDQLGWVLPDQPVDTAALTSVRAIATFIHDAAAALEAYRAAGQPDLSDLEDLVNNIAALLNALEGLRDQPLPTGLPEPFSTSSFWVAMAAELASYLLAGYLRREQPLLFALLRLTGVLDLAEAQPDANRVDDHSVDVVRWDRLAKLITNPAELMAEIYGWGGTLRFDALLRRLEEALDAIGILAFRANPGQERIDRHYGTAITAPIDIANLRVPLFVSSDTSPYVELGLEAFPIPSAVGTEVPVGMLISPYGTVALPNQISLSDEVTLRFSGTADGSGAIGAIVRPGEVQAFLDGTSLTGTLGVEIAYAPDSPQTLIGNTGGTAVSIANVSIALELLAAGATISEAVASLRFEHLKLTINFGEGDGFINTITGGLRQSVQVDGAVVWSSVHGIHLEGTSSLVRTMPLNITLGPIELAALTLAVVEIDSRPQIAARLVTKVKLGPVVGVVEGVGATLDLVPDPSGAFFGLSPEFDFASPSGVGLTIDAGAVTGGGFLFFDAKNEQYAGALHLEFERLTLNAIGLLTTRMPDGSSGFSLLVIVQASGFTPIQLGFGFTLSGVGGLLGINRTVVVDVLRTGIRNKTLDSILFSEDDPTPRAPQIVSTLQSVFPPAANQYAFGPMALIGWGTPTLLTIEIALILELPSPVRLIVLGRLRAALPDPEHAIVSINLDVLGVIDFDRGELSVDASLYDSRVGPFALTGDMAARASWGTTPDFAMALGGFHPAYKPPPGFPELRRLALALSTGSNPRVRMEAYFALTSNTVQVGARLELYVEAAGFSLEGGLGFDTLIQFSPFRLLAEIYARLALKSGATTLMGLDIHVHLIGPAPWVLWGEASFKLLFISIPIPFRVTIGRAEEPPALAREAVWEKLRKQLIAPESWAAQLPPEGDQLVVLRGEAKGGEVLAHPLGSLSVSQRVVPLERTLEMFGAAPPKDYDRFDIEGAQGLEIDGKTSDYFAPAQFRRMRDEEKLTSPSFERMVSGVRLSAEGAAQFGHVQETPLDYEQSVILDMEQPEPERPAERYAPEGAAVAALAEHSPAGTAELRDQGRAKFAPDEPGPKVAEPAYVVAQKDVLLESDSPDGLDGTYTGAVEHLRTRPDRDELQVVREEEVERV